jgi:hypothetical protein
MVSAEKDTKLLAQEHKNVGKTYRSWRNSAAGLAKIPPTQIICSQPKFFTKY